MIDALRYEWTRLTTLRGSYILLGAAFGLMLVLPIVLTASEINTVPNATEGSGLIIGGYSFVQEITPIPAVLVGVLGAFSIGHEYRYNTIRPTLLAVPSRSALLTAKIMVIVAVTLVVTLLGMVVNSGLIAAFTGKTVPLGGQAGTLVGFVLLMVGWCVLGFSLALAFRQTLAAVGAMLVMPVMENIVRGVAFIPKLDFLKTPAQFLPMSAGNNMAFPAGQERLTSLEPLTRGESSVVFWCFVLAVLMIGWFRFLSKDA